MFWFIFAFDIAITELMLIAGDFELGSALIGTAPLSFWQQFTCWVLGALSLAVNIALKKIPKEKFEFVRTKVNLEDPNDQDEVTRYVAKFKEHQDKFTAVVADQP